MKSPYEIIKRRLLTEKSTLIEGAPSERLPERYKAKRRKAVFVVDDKSTKAEIAWAVEQIYNDEGLKVFKVNTLNTKAKQVRVRGRKGVKSGYRKAIVTFTGDRGLEPIIQGIQG